MAGVLAGDVEGVGAGQDGLAEDDEREQAVAFLDVLAVDGRLPVGGNGVRPDRHRQLRRHAEEEQAQAHCPRRPAEGEDDQNTWQAPMPMTQRWQQGARAGFVRAARIHWLAIASRITTYASVISRKSWSVKTGGTPAARASEPNIINRTSSRYGTSSTSKKLANQVKPIQAHHRARKTSR